MKVLDNECENVLNKAINYEKSNRSKNKNKNVHIIFSEKICSSQIINKLKDAGYINLKEEKHEENELIFHFTLTRDGENYFKDKKKRRNIIIRDCIKFWIPILISIVALIVSIVK